MLCIDSSNSSSRFCSHLNKVIDIQHTPLKKKKKKGKKQIPRKQQSSVTVVVPGTIFFISFSIIIWKENILE